MSQPGLVLASASPRRLALLAQIAVVPDRTVSPAIDEAPKRFEAPRDYVRRMARGKAACVTDASACVLAADTVVAAGRRILPKAETPQQARTCLELLSGRRHKVMTAVVLAGPGRTAERLVESIVTFSRLSPEQIEAYVASEEWQGKAGGYAIQGRAGSLVRFLSGSYSNVVGLPLYETAQLLRGFGWSLP